MRRRHRPASHVPGRASEAECRATSDARRATSLLLLCAGCGERYLVLDPGARQAAEIERLWWIFFAICAAVYFAVIVVLLGAVARSRRGREIDEAARERRLSRAVGAGAGLTVLLLFVLTGASYSTGRALSSDAGGAPIEILVTGRQWWWELRYESDTPAEIVTTANEMHVPVGRPVHLRLTSADVIHSFWVPSLHGKKDLIPGQATTLAFRAERAGVYYGQCAEFCGTQHARMAMLVIAEPPAEFDAWLAHQRSAAAAPSTPERRRGQEVFLAVQCPMCHRIAGTPAGGLNGPDLTHLASRRTIAAGSLPNTRGHRAGWIVDPQRLKPGVKMPINRIAASDLNALLDYLDGLE
jgi:cytochrome c oxidase subunit 2